MKNALLIAALLIVMGGGCVVTTTPSSQTALDWETAFPSGSWQFANTDEYYLPVDYAFTLEQTGDNVRVQNFVGSDDPNFNYADDAFFIEIGLTSMPRSEIAEVHESIETTTLAGQEVMRGNDRVVEGDSWGGHSYFNDSNDVLINLFYQDSEGEKLAEAVIQQINWRQD